MSLILAIEPNKNQAQQLNALVRAHLKAELVTAPTAAAALTALGDRIPDVVLTPALFGLKDEAALTERLRQLGSDGSHVQTLAIPILAAGSSRGGNGTLLGRKKEKGDSEHGCDPAVFAEQIRIYLQRAAVERRAQVSEAAARAMTAAPASDEAPAIDELAPYILGADELDVDSLELTTIPPPTPPAPAPPLPTPAAAASPDRPATSDDAHERREKSKQKSPVSAAVEEELGLVTPPAAGPPLWRVAESIEDFYSNAESFAAGSEGPAAKAGAGPAVAGAPAANIQPPAASMTPRPRRTPPHPDEWGYFDPSQNAFKALIRRLDEIAGSAA
jgi:CheY-like chemotaxis protein